MKLRVLPSALLPLAVVFSGCLGDVMEIFCEAGPDSDHCYQATAIQESEPEKCQKIGGEGFSGSNPPKDKCYLLIGENTGDASACEGMEGGFMSYSPEECYDKVFNNHTVEDCADAADEMKCRSAWARKDKGCGDGYWFDKEKSTCVKGEPPKSDDVDSKAKEDLQTIKDAATGKYMELLEKAIDTETDPAKLAGLQAYKEFLDTAGEKIETASATWEKMEKLKQIFIDSYDPSMSIDRMSVSPILDDGLFTKIKNNVFGEKAKSETEQEYSRADDALSVYEAMLKRQGDNDQLKKSRLERLKDAVGSELKDSGTEKVNEAAKGIAEGIAGKAFVAVGIVDHALTSFKDAAQKEVFIGLSRAYNRRRDALAQERPNLSKEELHNITVQQVKEDPYRDNTNLGAIKHGNLLENKDCQDEDNPLCIDNRVFWTAMDKTYEYNNKKK